jgi:hypothetical protein
MTHAVTCEFLQAWDSPSSLRQRIYGYIAAHFSHFSAGMTAAGAAICLF